MNEKLLKLKIGNATPNPKETARLKRKMKGAERRKATHKVRLNRYRKIIAERAVQSVQKNGEQSMIMIDEPAVYEFRMKRLQEEAKYLAAKRDYNKYRQLYEEAVGESADALRDILKSERAAVFASRNSRKFAGVVMEHLKKGESNGSSALKDLFPLVKSGHRKEFRSAVGKFMKDVDPKTSEQFEKKPKLFSRVIEELAAELRNMDLDDAR